MSSNDNSYISDKEYIRGVVRKVNASHKNLDEGRPVKQIFHPIENLQVEFWKNFQANGGKILRCTTRQERLNFLQRLAKDQQYNIVLNTHVNLCNDLDSIEINYVNSIPMNNTVDAVVALSTSLVARNGSIGFSQSISRFISMKNIAKDVIVISRMKDIFPDIESAILDRNKKNVEPAIEFLTPSTQIFENNQDLRSAKNPRFILLLMCENESQNA